jgi:hypothetical protein
MKKFKLNRKLFVINTLAVTSIILIVILGFGFITFIPKETMEKLNVSI